MAVFRVPGPIGRNQVPPSIDDGTICRAASPLPGPSTSKRKSQQSPADLHWSANRQTPKTNALTPERKRIKFKKPTPLETLRLGAQGEIVRKLQRLLNTRVSPNPGLAVDGMFGPKTREAVLAFQNAQHLAPDAIVGPQTWYFLLKNEPVKPQFSPLNSVQTPPKPAPGQMAPTVTAPVTKRAVWEWSLKEKLLAVVERVPKRLGPQLRKEWEALIQPESLVISLLIIAGFWFLSGGTALILGLVLLGADAGMALASAIMTASQAANEEELDEAAGELAHVVITLGVAAFLHGVGKAVGKLRGGKASSSTSGAKVPKGEPGGSSGRQVHGELSELGHKPKPGSREVTQDQFRSGDAHYRGRETAESYSGHGHGRHGSQTTMSEQTRRVQTGEAPDGNRAPANKATKFDNHAKEVEAVERAKAQNPGQGKPKFRPDGRPNRDVKIVDDGPEGYGSGVEVKVGPDNQPLPGRPVQPTGQQPNAKVIFEYNPKTDSWEPLTQYPTNELVTP